MPEFSKKRRASAEDPDESDTQVSAKPAKKNKSAASAAPPDGEDDEGNPFWEVRDFDTPTSSVLTEAASSRIRDASESRSSKRCALLT